LGEANRSSKFHRTPAALLAVIEVPAFRSRSKG
jgi:hypothetical protein